MNFEQIQRAAKAVTAAAEAMDLEITFTEALESVKRRLVYGEDKMDTPFILSYLRNPRVSHDNRLGAPDSSKWDELSQDEKLLELVISGIVLGFCQAGAVS